MRHLSQEVQQELLRLFKVLGYMKQRSPTLKCFQQQGVKPPRAVRVALQDTSGEYHSVRDAAMRVYCALQVLEVQAKTTAGSQVPGGFVSRQMCNVLHYDRGARACFTVRLHRMQAVSLDITLSTSQTIMACHQSLGW